MKKTLPALVDDVHDLAALTVSHRAAVNLEEVSIDLCVLTFMQ